MPVVLVGTARCQVCGELATGDPATVDKVAEKHVKATGHPTVVSAVPAPQPSAKG